MASLKEWATNRKAMGLVSQLSSPDPQVCNAAVSRLAAMGNSVLPCLLEALKSPDRRVRASVAYVFCKTRPPAALEPLAERLSDPDDDVRVAVCRALKELGERAVPVLLRCLEGPRPDVRRAAALILGELGDPRATRQLVACLNDDDDVNVRQAAAEAIGAIGDPRAVPPLVSLLHGDCRSGSHRALTALTRIGTPAALTALKEWRERDYVPGHAS
jgi:HEAT repeat protein